MIYRITLEYEVEANTQVEAIRKIKNDEVLTFKHIKTEEEDGLQSEQS